MKSIYKKIITIKDKKLRIEEDSYLLCTLTSLQRKKELKRVGIFLDTQFISSIFSSRRYIPIITNIQE